MKNLFKKLLICFLFINLISCSSENTNHDNFEAVFLRKIEQSDLSNNVLFVTKVNNSEFSFEVKDGFETAFELDKGNVTDNYIAAPDAPDGHQCEGSGLSFARCCKEAADAGKCLLVYKSGSTYYADVVPCPKK